MAPITIPKTLAPFITTWSCRVFDAFSCIFASFPVASMSIWSFKYISKSTGPVTGSKVVTHLEEFGFLLLEEVSEWFTVSELVLFCKNIFAVIENSCGVRWGGYWTKSRDRTQNWTKTTSTMTSDNLIHCRHHQHHHHCHNFHVCKKKVGAQ